MTVTLQQIVNSKKKSLWIDDTDYVNTLLAKGQTPWLDIAAFVALKRTAQTLLNSDIIQLPVLPLSWAWGEHHPELIQLMASKKRAGFALKMLLADESFRQHVLLLSQSLRASFSTLPFALLCPSPQAWLIYADQMVHGTDSVIEIDEDDIDSASVYIADFLRIFGEIELNILMLKEYADTAPLLDLYQSIFNVAAHYSWEVALYTDHSAKIDSDNEKLLMISPVSSQSAIVSPEYWQKDSTIEAVEKSLLFVNIPDQTNPELVLSRLSALRN